ncbi:UNVERIFIED_ORG: hypothetical protein FNL38_1011163 [Nocardia globerula]|uniref:Uncharacterized protein n=1 Tax=Nocardia globerula TaxID=1818 RepID=A0A652YYM6_NOCGL|nr:hypothetical protein SZ00_05127 [Rhodococcus sp. AD45]PVX65095.1 hypothetical protein C8E04_2382 [Rhodococcus globerulus]
MRKDLYDSYCAVQSRQFGPANGGHRDLQCITHGFQDANALRTG